MARSITPSEFYESMCNFTYGITARCDVHTGFLFEALDERGMPSFPHCTIFSIWSFFTSQVGDGDADHAWWGRPEDNHMFRPTYAIGAGKPTGGADIMGESAAAMAAVSVIFKDKGKIIERQLHTL